MNTDNSKPKLANEIPVAPSPVPGPATVQPANSDTSIDGIKTMRQVESNNYKKSLAPSPVGQVKEPLKKRTKAKLTGKTILFGLVSLVALLFFCAVISIYTNFDSAFSDLKLEGKVLSSVTNEPINGATIFVDDELSYTTKEDGKYKITGLKQGKVKLRVEANGFRTQEVELGLGNTFFSYTTNKDFLLEPSSKSTLTGSFIGASTDHDFTDDTLEINGKSYAIAKNGTFTAADVTDGTAKLVYKSIAYKDIQKTIQINSSAFNLDPLNLEPSGDITGEMISFIREDKVLDANVTVESVSSNQISISDDGLLTVSDLEIGKTYKLRIEASNYETRDYEIKIVQGENKLFNLSLAENGTAYYLKFREEGKEYNIYSSDYDGIDEKQLTNDPKLEPFNLYLDTDENKLYFQTQKDSVQSTIRDRVGIVYTLDLSNNSLNKVTTSTTNLGNVVPNFKAKKAINLTKGSDSKSRVLQIMNLDGSNRTDLKTLSNGTIDNIFFSEKGDIVYFVEKDITNNKYGLYYLTVSDKSVKPVTNDEEIAVLDISPDGTKVLFTSKNKTTSFKDLQIFNTATKDLKSLKQNYSGFQYQFVEGSNDTVLFFDKKGGIDNIFTLNVDSLVEKQITDLRDIDKITNIYQQNNLLYYITQRGLNILDLTQPKTGKILKEGVFSSI